MATLRVDVPFGTDAFDRCHTHMLARATDTSERRRPGNDPGASPTVTDRTGRDRRPANDRCAVRILVSSAHSFRSFEPWTPGITGGIIAHMAMTLRLADDEAEALRRRAELESRSMQEVARQAIREYVESHSRTDLLDRVLDQELPRYAEALRRLGE